MLWLRAHAYNLPLESSMMAFLVVSGSSILVKWPGPEPRSRIVLNLRLISCESVNMSIPTAVYNTHQKPLYHPVGDLLSDVVDGSTAVAIFPCSRTVLLQGFYSSIEYLEWSDRARVHARRYGSVCTSRRCERTPETAASSGKHAEKYSRGR